MIGMADERVWLSQEIDGVLRHFHCPAEAAEAWADMGWQPAEAPPEPVDPAIAHIVEARRQAAIEQVTYPDGVSAAEVFDSPEAPPADTPTKPTTRAARRGGTQE